MTEPHYLIVSVNEKNELLDSKAFRGSPPDAFQEGERTLAENGAAHRVYVALIGYSRSTAIAIDEMHCIELPF